MENCIFSDKDVKNAVHKSLIETASFNGRQIEILDSLKQYTKELNDNAILHSNSLKDINKTITLFVKIFFPAFIIVTMVAFVAVGGGEAIEKSLGIFSKIK